MAILDLDELQFPEMMRVAEGMGAFRIAEASHGCRAENTGSVPYYCDWQPIVKVEHYRLKVESIRNPVELRGDRAPYQAGKGDEPTC